VLLFFAIFVEELAILIVQTMQDRFQAKHDNQCYSETERSHILPLLEILGYRYATKHFDGGLMFERREKLVEVTVKQSRHTEEVNEASATEDHASFDSRFVFVEVL